ncbi:rod shape-determining protein MreC [Polynucleobacter paneuropaeus]|uniref:Cell shape-determining protein MreC n=1 Tax=Polynucleobacter paneuropaeus TaxID=2527775 RepID=A0A9Q7CQK6_9BURK|nr:rod shape-determining protein MreC [Polynucleobacter paneuropaeus]AWW45147.1 rod shape-determining protein MreC [Polynucleobacter paneuropaeus]AWW46946.1 rod shape-determining protein MreC [Polynucleobacter paneuropaeus]MBT8514781.1 rod shape-determining protein MreC [Polynucleobacter paneuropaeus]MBT8516932.1 rod shape-determining protein MreC [Polynucleobacter paneuropaeus]MBT8517509.1 rod shape-determining protein MreC [Polynucleobacter paneuropaeus]
MQYSAPPLFRQGIPALVKLIVCLSISIALMLIDYRFKTLDPIRNNVNWVLRPLEYLMLTPRNVYQASTEYFTTRSTLEQENQIFKARQAELALLANQSEFLLIENQNLRQLMDLQKQVGFKTLPVEILFNPPNPISQRVVINRGNDDGLKLGNPIANDAGILGQVVRLYDHSAEVSLLEDRDFAVPVQVARNGLRAAVFGAGRGNPLELRYLPVASDLEVGDILITSGIDGVYPPGYAVAVISRIERNVDKNSSNVFCVPIAAVNRYRQALAFLYDPQWDAKAPALNSKFGSSTATPNSAPGRRQTRSRGMQ